MATSALLLACLVIVQTVVAISAASFSIQDTLVGDTLAAKLLQNDDTGQCVCEGASITNNIICRGVCGSDCGLWWPCRGPCSEVYNHPKDEEGFAHTQQQRHSCAGEQVVAEHATATMGKQNCICKKFQLISPLCMYLL